MVKRIVLNMLSYLVTVPLKKEQSQYSGTLYVQLYQGRKILDTDQVNYSFNSLHRVFKKAFKRTRLERLKIEKILILGLGGGSIVELLRRDYGITTPIKAVDIDPAIIKLAKEEFEIEQYAPIELITADAAVFLAGTTETFDLICMDVFIHDTVPGELMTAKNAERMVACIRPEGRIYFNVMVKEGGDLDKNFLSVFTDYSNIKLTVLEVEETNRVLVIEKIF